MRALSCLLLVFVVPAWAASLPSSAVTASSTAASTESGGQAPAVLAAPSPAPAVEAPAPAPAVPGAQPEPAPKPKLEGVPIGTPDAPIVLPPGGEAGEAAAVGAAGAAPADSAEAPPEPEEPPPPVWGPIAILGEEVAPGEERELSLPTSESYIGAGVDIPVVVIRGVSEGPSLCLTAGVHGDELNGIEIVRETLDQIRPRALSGTLIGVPIVNLHGFQTSSRYLPDRRDLNRHFPGSAEGSSASRIAWQLFDRVVRHCDALIDLHTGSAHRSNLPQVRGDLKDERVLELAKAFGATVTIHNRGATGTLRRAAQEAGIPAVIYEAGEPMRFQTQEIRRGVVGVRNAMLHMKMLRGSRVSLGEQRVFFRTSWVRAPRGGILATEVRLGDNVREGDILGTITDPIRKEKTVVVSPSRGRVIGMAMAPVMIPGYAAFHLGVPGPLEAEPEDSLDYEQPE